MNILQEMAKELLPSLSNKEDLLLIKQLRRLEKKDPLEFEEKLARINLSRRSEGLPSLHKNEIMSKSLVKDIKDSMPKRGMGDDKLKLLSNRESSDVFNGECTFDIEIDGKKHFIYLKSHLSSTNNSMYWDIDNTYFTSPVNHIIKDKEVRFPELNKKIKFKIDFDGFKIYYYAKVVKL